MIELEYSHTFSTPANSACGHTDETSSAISALPSTSRGSTAWTIVPCHARHSHERAGLNCAITGALIVVDIAALASSRTSSVLARAPAQRSPPSRPGSVYDDLPARATMAGRLLDAGKFAQRSGGGVTKAASAASGSSEHARRRHIVRGDNATPAISERAQACCVTCCERERAAAHRAAALLAAAGACATSARARPGPCVWPSAFSSSPRARSSSCCRGRGQFPPSPSSRPHHQHLLRM